MDQSVSRTEYNTDAIRKFKRMSAGAALVMLLLLLRGDRGGGGAGSVAAGSDVKLRKLLLRPQQIRELCRGARFAEKPCATLARKGPLGRGAQEGRKVLLRQEDARRVRRRVVLETQQHVVDEELRVLGGAGARVDIDAQVRRRAREAAHAPDGGSNSWWKFRR